MKVLRIPTARVARVIGPGFLAAALIAPNLLALLDSPSLQNALLLIGLSAALVSAALAMYHWSFARRLFHLSSFFILLELFYRIAYGGAVSYGVLLSIPETSDRETAELLGGHAFLTTGLSLVAVITLCVLVISWSAGRRFAMRRCIQVGAVAVFMMAAAMAAGGFQRSVARVEGAFPIDVARAVGAVAIDWIDTRLQAGRRADFQFPNVHLTNADLRSNATEIYVIVIGETSRRQNWSLFGYPR